MIKEGLELVNFRIESEMKALLHERIDAYKLEDPSLRSLSMSAYVRQLIYRDLKEWNPERFAEELSKSVQKL